MTDFDHAEISKAEREHTPPELAEWLVALAMKCDCKAKTRPLPYALPQNSMAGIQSFPVGRTHARTGI